jgi:hypothetical protein
VVADEPVSIRHQIGFRVTEENDLTRVRGSVIFEKSVYLDPLEVKRLRVEERYDPVEFYKDLIREAIVNMIFGDAREAVRAFEGWLLYRYDGAQTDELERRIHEILEKLE